MSNILVTGATGYIGSHAVLSLLSSGYGVVALDNFSSSGPAALERIRQIAGESITFIEGDVRDSECLDAIFDANKISAVMHFAGLKSVGESCQYPQLYHDNNVVGSKQLITSMHRAGVHRLIFSSSATVYGIPQCVPINEYAPVNPNNPYGVTKLEVEKIISDLCTVDSHLPWQAVSLRYFNPIGAHSSGMLGEDPKGTPNNIMPYITKVAIGQLDSLPVFGNDYDTADGTGIRDYVHVVDLVEGHLLALDKIMSIPLGQPFYRVWNLGAGRGYSVLELINEFRCVTGVDVPYHVVARRPGDVEESWADLSLVRSELGWEPSKSLHDMVQDSWRWQTRYNSQPF